MVLTEQQQGECCIYKFVDTGSHSRATLNDRLSLLLGDPKLFHSCGGVALCMSHRCPIIRMKQLGVFKQPAPLAVQCCPPAGAFVCVSTSKYSSPCSATHLLASISVNGKSSPGFVKTFIYLLLLQ